MSTVSFLARPTAPPRSTMFVVPALAVIGLYVSVLGYGMSNWSFDIWGAFVVAPVLLVVTIPLVTRSARQEGDRFMERVLVLAVLTKVVFGTLTRYAMVYEVYGGGDAQGYYGAGRKLAAGWRSGELAVDLGTNLGSEGTAAMNAITGVIFLFTGPTKLGGFFVYSWLAFLGMFLFYRAYRMAFPDGNYRRYALLLFFVPTTVFWPSSIGKEAWLLFTLGVATYGAARILARRPAGFLILGLGLWGSAVVRPHMTLLVFAGLAVGYLLRRSTIGGGSVITPAKVVGILALVGVGYFVIGSFASRFNLNEGVDTRSVDALLAATTDKSSTDGSQFEPVSATNPVELPYAIVTVLFRPFPQESGGGAALVTSLEGVVLFGLFALSWRSLKRVAGAFFRRPYVALCAVYSLLFIVAFSSIANFGILARQRAQVMPYVLVLLTIPVMARRSKDVSPDPAGARTGAVTVGG